MDEIKVSLTIKLPGAVMWSKEECLKTIKEVITLKNGKKKTITKVVEDWDKMDKHTFKAVKLGKDKPETIVFYTRKCVPATQSINMNKDAYEYMTDKNSCPSWSKPSKWNSMSKKERLESHLQMITEHLDGISFTYQVFDD